MDALIDESGASTTKQSLKSELVHSGQARGTKANDALWAIAFMRYDLLTQVSSTEEVPSTSSTSIDNGISELGAQLRQCKHGSANIPHIF